MIMADKVAQIASRMYGISMMKSRLMIEQLLKEYSELSEAEVLKMIGERSLFYVNSVK